jgi:hypothetical protein
MRQKNATHDGGALCDGAGRSAPLPFTSRQEHKKDGPVASEILGKRQDRKHRIMGRMCRRGISHDGLVCIGKIGFSQFKAISL